MSSIPPINKSYEVIEKDTSFIGGRFLRWLNEIVQRLNRAVITDSNGNVSYKNTPIPEDVHPDYFHIFYPNNAVRIIYPNGVLLDVINGYIRIDSGLTTWQYITSGVASITLYSSVDSSVNRFTAIDSGGQLPGGSTIPWIHVHKIDASGNVNIKTGSTYSSTL